VGSVDLAVDRRVMTRIGVSSNRDRERAPAIERRRLTCQVAWACHRIEIVSI
jgi:hypothetical protein